MDRFLFFFFFSSRRRHTRLTCDWSSDVCSSDLPMIGDVAGADAFPAGAGRLESGHPTMDRRSTLEIGIGLPNSVREANGRNLIEFARRADQAGFTTLDTIDRIAFPSYESLVTLAAAAAVTERIRLMPNVLL